MFCLTSRFQRIMVALLQPWEVALSLAIFRLEDFPEAKYRAFVNKGVSNA
jgi:hypothetical protein